MNVDVSLWKESEGKNNNFAFAFLAFGLHVISCLPLVCVGEVKEEERNAGFRSADTN